MIFHRTIFSLGLLLAMQPVIAQGGATIKAKTDKNKILIGEPLLLTIEAYFSPESVKNFITIDSIPHFEFLEKPVIDTPDKNGGLNIRAIYKLTSFDSGHWVIPSFILSKSIRTDTIPVDVIFSDFDPNKDYHDIKNIIEVKPKQKKQWCWYVAGAAALLALLLIYLLRKKKPAVITKPIIVINAFEEAMKELESLQRTKTETKQYYSRIVEIFRLYVYRKKGILSLQKTTDDLILQLKDTGLPKEQFEKLSQSLRLSDFVKFAKYLPSEEDDRKVMEEIRNSIITIEKSGGQVLPPTGGRI